MPRLSFLRATPKRAVGQWARRVAGLGLGLGLQIIRPWLGELCVTRGSGLLWPTFFVWVRSGGNYRQAGTAPVSGGIYILAWQHG